MLDNQFIFFPDGNLIGTPADVGLQYDEVFFIARDGINLHGWFIPGPRKKTLLWYHGNAGNISHRLENIKILHDQLNVNVFIFDYREYGLSEGKISEHGTSLDAEASIEYLQSRLELNIKEHLVLFGRSLGCAVYLEMATRHDVHRIILESPFTSIEGIGQIVYPYIPNTVLRTLVKSRYDSLSKIGDIGSPIMLIHGDQDQTIPIEQSRDLFEAANEPKYFYTIPGATHSDIYSVGGKTYFDAISRFIKHPIGHENKQTF